VTQKKKHEGKEKTRLFMGGEIKEAEGPKKTSLE